MLTENSLRQVDDKDNNHPRYWWVLPRLYTIDRFLMAVVEVFHYLPATYK